MSVLLALAMRSAAAATGTPAGCDEAPSAEIVGQLGARPGPVVDAEGRTWRLLGRSADAQAQVVACGRAAGSTADTVAQQWLVEAAPEGPAAAYAIGVVRDSSFQEAFAGPVRVARSKRLPASIPVWEVCGPWESGHAGDGARSDNGCRLVVSPVAARASDASGGQRIVTFLEAGEHPFMDWLAWFDTRSTWTASGAGWRITETWTWRDPPSGGVPLGGDGKPRAPLVHAQEVRWDAATLAFTVTPVGACDNHEAALAVFDPEGHAACLPR